MDDPFAGGLDLNTTVSSSSSSSDITVVVSSESSKSDDIGTPIAPPVLPGEHEDDIDMDSLPLSKVG